MQKYLDGQEGLSLSVLLFRGGGDVNKLKTGLKTRYEVIIVPCFSSPLNNNLHSGITPQNLKPVNLRLTPSLPRPVFTPKVKQTG